MNSRVLHNPTRLTLCTFSSCNLDLPSVHSPVLLWTYPLYILLCYPDLPFVNSPVLILSNPDLPSVHSYLPSVCIFSCLTLCFTLYAFSCLTLTYPLYIFLPYPLCILQSCCTGQNRQNLKDSFWINRQNVQDWFWLHICTIYIWTTFTCNTKKTLLWLIIVGRVTLMPVCWLIGLSEFP